MTVSRAKLIGIALVIFAVTFWLYWPSTHGGFLKVDDLEYLRQSMRWNGLTWNGAKWAVTSTDMFYHPLPRLYILLGYQIWGTNAAGHHATSVFLHALNAALVFGFLWTILGATSLTAGERLSVALWGALVFAIHPLQAESVAWMAVRTQLLCTTFAIGSLWAYAAGARRPVVWGLYVAALLSKPMAVSLPFVMLAMDCFPLRRHEQLGWGRLLREKALMIMLAGVVGVATVFTERGSGAIAPLFEAPLSVRVFRVFESLPFYLVKLVWPAHLAPNYVSDLPLGPWTVLASVLAVLIITAVVTCQRRRMPMLAAAWGAYVMLVIPMSAVLPRGRQVVAARYAYVVMLPVLLLVGAAGVWVWRRSTTAVRCVLVGLLACELCAFAAGTRRLIPDWHNDETMRRATVAEFPDSEQANRELATELLDEGKAGEALAYAQRGVEIAPHVCEAHVMLGLVLCQLGRLPEAIGQDEQAVQINPLSARANFGFGVALAQVGKIEEAIAQYEQALRQDPDFIDAHMNLGNTLSAQGRIQDAVAHYKEAVRIKPDNPMAHHNIGYALYQMGRVPEAIQEFEVALQIWPEYAEAHNSLGVALLRTGNVQDAIAQYEEALRINPGYAEAHNNLALALVQAGRVQEAIGHDEQALRLTPGHPETHVNLGLALWQTGRLREAIGQYEEALRIRPDFAEAHVDLGIALSQVGSNQEALAHFREALRLRPDSSEEHYNLGQALFQTGQVQDAIDHYEQALRIKPDYVEAHFNLGLALEKLGHTPEAIEHYRQALKLRPDFTPAREALARLRAGP
ncbi:MAG: tetratricopeptide repeat protein [Verrucomicrobiia bacterium]